jgi:hypothetical protein
MRKQFKLPEEDEQCLAAMGLEWEAIIEGNSKWVIVRSYPIPAGYNHRTADSALRISPSYPDDQIDMVYFSPGLALMKGKTIRQLTAYQLDGKQYQQWSRHRTAQNPWRPGLDNIFTHLLQVTNWLERELT